MPTIRHLNTFDLMQVRCCRPSRRTKRGEEVLISKLASISSGERATPRQFRPGGWGPVADKEDRIMQAALANPQMTEVSIVKALKAGKGRAAGAGGLRHQSGPTARCEGCAVGNKDTPSGRLIHLAAELPINLIKDVSQRRLTTQAKNSLLAVLEKRGVTTDLKSKI